MGWMHMFESVLAINIKMKGEKKKKRNNRHVYTCKTLWRVFSCLRVDYFLKKRMYKKVRYNFFFHRQQRYKFASIILPTFAWLISRAKGLDLIIRFHGPIGIASLRRCSERTGSLPNSSYQAKWNTHDLVVFWTPWSGSSSSDHSFKSFNQSL